MEELPRALIKGRMVTVKVIVMVIMMMVVIRDGRPAPRGGGVPRPDPPRKNDQNCGEVAGQNIGPNLNFLQ